MINASMALIDNGPWGCMHNLEKMNDETTIVITPAY